MSVVRLSVAGERDADVVLAEWLRSVPELRGCLRREVAPTRGEMGGIGELAIALSSTGAATALARAVQVWLCNRHRDVTVTFTTPDGREASIDVARARARDLQHLEKLLRTALEADSPDERR